MGRNKINKVIEESKYYEIECILNDFKKGATYSDSIEKIEKILSTTISKILSAIEEEVEGLPNLKIESIDHYGRKILWRGLTNKSDIQSLLQSAKKQIK